MKPVEPRKIDLVRNAIGRRIDALGTPAGLAEVFCDMSTHEQARFFGEVGRVMDGWGPVRKLTQLHSISRAILYGELAEAARVVSEMAAVLSDPEETGAADADEATQ